jgi:hypothetical protein
VACNPTGKNGYGYALHQAKLEERERRSSSIATWAMHIRSRSWSFQDKPPELAALISVIHKCSRMHDWKARCKAHDGAPRSMTRPLQPPPVAYDGTFDQIGALLQAANAAPAVTRPAM